MAGDTVEVTFEAVGAEDVLKELDGLVESFANVEKASDVDFSNFVSSLEEGTSAAQEFISTIEELVTGFESLGSGAENATGGISSLSGELQNAAGTSSEYASGTTEAAAASEELAAGISPLASGFGELTAGATEAAGGLTETTAATTETTGALTELSPAFSEVSSGAGEMNATLAEVQSAETEVVSSTQEVGTTFTEMGTSVTEASGTFTELNTATAETATGMVDIATETTNVSTEMTTMGTSVEENASRWQSLDTNIGSTVGFMGQATSGAISLATGFVRLEQAQNRVEKTQLRVSKASEALAKAQEKLNTLRASGTASSGDLAKAELDVEQASEQLRVTQEQLGIQQTNLNLRMTDFYAGIAPNVIQTVTGILAGISQMPAAFNKIGSALGITGGKFETTSGSVEGYNASLDQSIVANESYGGSLEATDGSLSQFGNDLGTTSGGLTTVTSKMGGALKAFGIAGAIIGVAAVALGLYATNSFGARDAIDAFGAAIGKAVPPLEGALVAVQNFAVDVGLAGDAAKAQVTHVETLAESVVRMGENIATAGQEMQTSWLPGTQMAGGAVETLGNTVATAGPKIVTEVSGWGQAFSDFGAAVERQDWATAFDLVVAGFQSVGVVAVEAGKLIMAGFNVVSAAVVGFFANAFIIIGNIVQEGVGRIGAWLAGGVDTHIVQPFGNAVLAVGKTFETGFGQIQTMVETAIGTIVTTIQGIAGQVTSIANELYTNLGIADFIQMAVGAITAFADQISAIVNAGIAKGREALGLAPVEAPEPHQVAPEQRQPQKKFEGATENTRLTNENTTALTNNAVAQGNVAKGLLVTNEAMNHGNMITEKAATGMIDLTGSVGKTVGGFNQAEGGINTAARSMSNYIKQGLISQQANKQLASSTAPVIDNFQAAKNIMPGFSDALNAQIAGTAKMTPEMQAYNDALQAATNSNARMSNAVLASKPATVAFGEALNANTGEFEKNFGAAEGYIAAMGQTEHITGMSQQGIINYSNALKAGKAELDRVTTGQQEANAAVQGTQAAYTSMTQAQVASAVGYQKEAQSLALGNILKADSNRATIALAEAQTQGTQKGVDFANSQFTAQASLTGYRAALSQAIAGNTQYGASLGLTTKQLENQLSFQNDVVAAQEEIINVGAEVVNQNNIQAEAWRTMSDQQIQNINTTNQQRAAWIQLKNPLADTADNMQAVNEAFLQGGEAANEFMLGLRTTSAEADGYKKRLNELIPAQSRVGDTAQYTVEQMERLATAFSGTSEAARQMGSSMVEAASSFIGMLKFDPEELHTKIDDAFKDVPSWIQDNFSHSLKGGLVAQGDIERLGTSFVQQTGAAITGAMRTEDPMKDIRGFTDALVEDFEQLDPEVQAALAPMMEHIKEIGKIAQVSGLDVTAAQFQKLGQEFTLASVEAEKAIDPFNEFYTSIGGISNITPQAAANIATLDGGLKSLSEQGLGASLGLAEVGTQAKAGQVPMVELTNAAGDVVGQFANVNGTLVPVNQGLSALVPASQLAGNALLGVGAFANAVTTRFGDIQEAIANTGTAMTLLNNIFVLGFQMAMVPITTFVTQFTTQMAGIQQVIADTGTAMSLLNNIFVLGFQMAMVPITTFVTTFATQMLAIQTAIATTGTAMSLLNNIFVLGFQLAMQTITVNTALLVTTFTITIPTAIAVTGTAMSLLNNIFVLGFQLAMVTIQTNTALLVTIFTITIPTAIATTGTAMMLLNNIFVLGFQLAMTTIQTNTALMVTIFTTTIPTAIATTGTAMMLLNNIFVTSFGIITGQLSTLSSAFQTEFGKIAQNIFDLGAGIVELQSLSEEALGAIGEATATLATDFHSSFSDIAQDVFDLGAGLLELAELTGTAFEEMTSHVEDFASAFSSSMDEVTSAAEQATQAVEDLQSAIDNLKDKTVTITTKFKTVGKPAAQHGGSFIIDSPRTFSGVKVGEHHKPELLTVTPLTNPNRNSDKTISMSRLAAATSTHMQRGGELLSGINIDVSQTELLRQVVKELIQVKQAVANQRMVANTILDGRLIDQTIQRSRSRKTEQFT